MTETIYQAIKRLSEQNVSSEEDSKMIERLLRMAGFTKAVVVTGIVYAQGRGQPTNIHTVAKSLLEVFKNQQIVEAI